MAKSMFEKYEEMLAQGALFGSLDTEPPKHLSAYDPDDDESEDFLTSKEIVKMQEDSEEHPGIVLPKGPVEIEEDVHFKRYSVRREHKYTEKELEEIRQSCEETIVHDYSEFDQYHMSDEERARNDSLNELGLKLGGLKRMYRKVDQYIEAMRVVVEAWELLEEKENFVHSEDEFFRMVAEGRIYHTRILMPKLKGMDKYNIDLLIKYISNPELDPSDLAPVQQTVRDSFYDQFDDIYDEDGETEEEEMERLLSPDEVQFILDNADNPPTIKVKDFSPKMIRGYDRKTFNSKSKKMSKKKRKLVEGLHEILNKIQSNPNNRDMESSYPRSFLLTNSMFEPQKKEKDIWDDLYFDGSWVSKDDLFLYDLAVREELLKQHPVGDRYQTFADKELQDFFRIMEDNGMNVVELRRRMNMSADSMKNEESKKVKKENRKIESALLQRITKLNGSPKFKKLVTKAEKAINEQMSDY